MTLGIGKLGNPFLGTPTTKHLVFYTLILHSVYFALIEQCSTLKPQQTECNKHMDKIYALNVQPHCILLSKKSC